MKEIGDFFSEEIAPRIFEQIDSLLPEFDFKMTDKGWISQNTYRPDGREGKSKFKVYVYENSPSIIQCYTSSPTMNLASYLAQRDGIKWIEAVKNLAEMVGIELPKSDYTPKHQNLALKDVIQYLNYLITQEEGNSVRAYLKARGFVDFSKFGVFVGIEQITKYLRKKNYDTQDIESALQLFDGLDGRKNTHPLAIPLLSSSGHPLGFILRAIRPEITPKYLFTKGFEKGNHLFNFGHRHASRIVLTEGQIDSLLAEQYIQNTLFCALGGSTLTDNQLKELLRHKNTPVITAFDDDNAGLKCSYQTVKKLLKHGFTDVSSVLAYAGCKDTAELIENQQDIGVTFLRNAIARPVPAKEILFHSIEPDDEFLTDTEYLKRVVSVAQDIADGFQKNIFLDFVMTKVQDVRKETIQQELDRQRFEFDKAKKQKKLQNAIAQAHELAKNDLSEAVKILTDALSKNSIIHAKQALKMPTASEFTALLRSEPERLKTGLLDDLWTVPMGAISLIAGRPSHGKTTFMYNCLLNQLELYPDKTFYFLSYEEPRQKIFLKMVTALVAKFFPDSLHIEATNSLSTCYGISDFEVLTYLKNPDTLSHEVLTWVSKALGIMENYIHSGRLVISDTPFFAEELPAVLSTIPEQSVIYLDYIQKIPTQESKTGFETGKYVSGILLNHIVIPKNIPLILGAQLNRVDAKSTTHAKSMSVVNLRESGDYEQDANSILLLHHHKFNDEPEAEKMSVKIGKNRDGEANETIELEFLGRNRFIRIIK